jgi:hypothetical protein
VSWRRLAAGQRDQLLFDLPCDRHFVWPFQRLPWSKGRLKTLFHALLSDTVDGGQTHA